MEHNERRESRRVLEAATAKQIPRPEGMVVLKHGLRLSIFLLRSCSWELGQNRHTQAFVLEPYWGSHRFPR